MGLRRCVFASRSAPDVNGCSGGGRHGNVRRIGFLGRDTEPRVAEREARAGGFCSKIYLQNTRHSSCACIISHKLFSHFFLSSAHVSCLHFNSRSTASAHIRKSRAIALGDGSCSHVPQFGRPQKGQVCEIASVKQVADCTYAHAARRRGRRRAAKYCQIIVGRPFERLFVFIPLRRQKAL